MGEGDNHDIPAPLRPLVPFVERWGAIESDTQRYEYAGRAEQGPEALREFEKFCARWTAEVAEAFEAWEKRNPMTECELTAKFFYTILLADELEFSLPSAKGEKRVQELIEALRHECESRRAAAAQTLSDFGDCGVPAIPFLRDALLDESTGVRIWAHYTLAILEREEKRHRSSIERIAELVDGRERVEARTALEWLAKSQEWRDIQSLVGFCITNDVGQIERLSAQVDVNGPSKDGSRPLGFAVGNAHPAATRALLERNADPNLRDEGRSATVLHTAATKRRGPELVPLLLAFGAEVNAGDEKGRTPLDWALEFNAKETARLLRDAGGRRGSRWRRLWRR